MWAWVHEPWEYPVPDRSVVATNLAALQGQRVSEVSRWEDAYWEAFAGAGAEHDRTDARMVPLATLLGADPSMAAATRLGVGQSLRRGAGDTDWSPWISS